MKIKLIHEHGIFLDFNFTSSIHRSRDLASLFVRCYQARCLLFGKHYRVDVLFLKIAVFIVRTAHISD
jgi:hypothetical protein